MTSAGDASSSLPTFRHACGEGQLCLCPARACKDRDSSTAEDLELVTVRCVVVYVLYSVERVWSKQDVLDDECALERVEH